MILGVSEKRHDSVDINDLPPEAPPAYEEFVATSSQLVAPSTTASQARRSGTRRSSRPAAALHDGRSVRRTTPQELHQGPRPGKPATGPLALKAQDDVRKTVRGLLRDLVQGSSPVTTSAALGILDSCAAACVQSSLSLARILQARWIEGRSPIYWAIISRLVKPGDSKNFSGHGDDAFLLALISRAAPLAPTALSDLRAACLNASENVLFQCLRFIPGVVPLTGTDRILLSGSNKLIQDGSGRSNDLKAPEILRGFGDVAKVREGNAGSDADTFSVSVQLRLFQRRMRVSGQASVEFIARGRLWLLHFFVVPPSPSPSSTSSPRPDAGTASTIPSAKKLPTASVEAARTQSLPPGSWAVALALLEDSPQCYAVARLVIQEPLQDRDLPPLPDTPHPPSSPLSTSKENSLNPTSPGQRGTHASAGSFELRQEKRTSCSSNAVNENRNVPKPGPPIILNLISSGTSPLLPLPSLFDSPFTCLNNDDDLFSDGSKSGKRRRPTKEEKRAARAAAAKERCAQKGKETRKERKERKKSGKTVLLTGLEEVSMPDTDAWRKESAKSGMLMYDGCSHIAPDGTLRAVLEARLTTSPPDAKESDCVIC